MDRSNGSAVRIWQSGVESEQADASWEVAKVSWWIAAYRMAQCWCADALVLHFGSVGGRPRPSPCPSAPVPRSTCVVHAIREKKDLRNYDSLEDLQAEMQNEANPNQNLFTIGGILNTLSNTAFGAERNVGSGGLRPGRPTMATLGIYVSWGIGFGYRGLLRSLGTLKARWGRRELKEEDLPPDLDQ
eukprot:gene5374-5594_t